MTGIALGSNGDTAPARIDAGTSLPGNSAGYGRGSRFTLIGAARELGIATFLNVGTNAAVDWRVSTETWTIAAANPNAAGTQGYRGDRVFTSTGARYVQQTSPSGTSWTADN